MTCFMSQKNIFYIFIKVSKKQSKIVNEYLKHISPFSNFVI